MTDATDIVEGEEIGLEAPEPQQVLRALDGRWLPGTSGNRGGRPPKKREERFVNLIAQAVTDQDVIDILKKAVEQAKEGDRWARRFLWEYAVGKPRVRPPLDAQEAPILTLMKFWVAEASGDPTLIKAAVAQLVGTLPEE